MNVLTVDVEDYYQTNGLNISENSWSQYESRVEKNTRKLLDQFENHQVRGTFFIVGHIAKQFPSLVKEIASKGHEIGSHSNMHRMLTSLDPSSFREDVRISKSLLEDISGQAVVQYRAPSWSLNSERYEWLGILEEEGYLIDSSIQPFRTPLSGSSNAPIAPFRPIINGKQLSIIEFPSTVWNWGHIRIPFSGGLYLRVMPNRVFRALMKSINRTRSGMVYIHPWEIDPSQPRIPVSPLIRFAQYYRLGATEAKLEWLLKEFDLNPLGYVVDTLLRESKIPNVAL
jgi:polysaccharide deacetylase family protein (PEP-CTERM system associated)